jgi:hypothetical protein
MKRITIPIEVKKTTAQDQRVRAIRGVMDLPCLVMIQTQAIEDVSAIVQVRVDENVLTA